MDNQNDPKIEVNKLSDAQALTVTQVMRLTREARAGNTESYETLKRASNLMAVEANKRLNRLQSKGYTDMAYALAQSFTSPAYNSTRYDTQLENIDSLYAQTLSLRKFLEKRTSTVKGYKEVIQERREAFREAMEISSDPSDETYMSDRKLTNFLRLLGNTPIRALISEKHKNGSEELVELYRQAYERKRSAYKELKILTAAYMATKNDPDAVPLEEHFYYDELMEYLETGKHPSIRVTPTGIKRK